MARRPSSEKPEKLTEEDLEELRYNPAHLTLMRSSTSISGHTKTAR
jgi:hypothetical protein